jgi:hypothetical protein
LAAALGVQMPLDTLPPVLAAHGADMPALSFSGGLASQPCKLSRSARHCLPGQMIERWTER